MKWDLNKFIYKKIKPIPMASSYTSVEMYQASSNSLFILARELKDYYGKQDQVILEWLYYWLQDRINGKKMLIDILGCIYVPVCIGICSCFATFEANPGYSMILLVVYFVFVMYHIFKSYAAKDYYEFHMKILEKEYTLHKEKR